jgi:hypothetical protein
MMDDELGNAERLKGVVGDSTTCQETLPNAWWEEAPYVHEGAPEDVITEWRVQRAYRGVDLTL